MAQSFRKSQILEIANETGRVSVEELAARFGVTSQTIRRDLSELADLGKLDRVHGGAIMPPGAGNIGYAERRATNEAEKAAIARLCAAEIPNNSSVLLNIGTSTEAVAVELLGHENLTVITNNLNVAAILAANHSCQIIVAGGILRHCDGGLVGDLTLEVIDQFKVDRAIIGTSAVDEDGDLLDFDLQEVRVSRAIIRQSKRTFLVTDRSKFTRTAPVKIASLREIDAIFTDSLPNALREQCGDWGTAVHDTGG
ncbi:transcriptional regulator, DeoR family [Tranquillimonas rosea]|uniref:Transcriptional regulator, DeoR family n=1 Tax=Tranquillimonas rosea TaxID=641238 RepID=A0A1H9WJM1_9RHOB|nr:DeoR/GlpR family DNA-binding transcription regulator [Tranquillimonas rosea]SES33939.1 transcriptional regulator, DeoR family [Tranquillimonas rosea]